MGHGSMGGEASRAPRERESRQSTEWWGRTQIGRAAAASDNLVLCQAWTVEKPGPDAVGGGRRTGPQGCPHHLQSHRPSQLHDLERVE